MMVHQGFNFLLEVFIKILLRGARDFFILLSGVQFFLLYLWRWYYVIFDNLSLCFMIHMFSRVRYLNPSFSLRSSHLSNQSISSLQLSWVIFHLKPSLRIVTIMVLINDPSSSFILLVKQFLVPLSYKSNIFSSLKSSLQPNNLFFGVILGYISPKAFPEDCSYPWCL